MCMAILLSQSSTTTTALLHADADDMPPCLHAPLCGKKARFLARVEVGV